MRFRHLIMQVVIATSLISCAFIPKESEDQEYREACNMQTKRLTLSVEAIDGRPCDSSIDANACLMIWGVIVPVGSFVVSGSIVFVGNTLHWLEYQGTCEVT